MKQYKMIILLVAVLVLSSLTQAQAQVRYDHGVSAMTKVGLQYENQEQYQAVEQAMQRLQTQDRQRINNLFEPVVTEAENGLVIAEGKVPARLFGLFELMRTNRYVIGQDGSLQYRAQWHDFMWSEFEV